jgi:hypothetical protein
MPVSEMAWNTETPVAAGQGAKQETTQGPSFPLQTLKQDPRPSNITQAQQHAIDTHVHNNWQAVHKQTPRLYPTP